MTSPLRKKREAVFATLLYAFHPDNMEKILGHLSQEEAALVESFPPQLAISPIIEPLKEELGKIHYSWFFELLRSKQPIFQECLLKSLAPSSASPLATLLKISTPHSTSLAPVLENFFLLQLKQELRMAPVIPRSYLPHHPLNVLTQFSKRELVRLTAFLGLRDLAASLRKVVDRSEIFAFKESLSKAQQVYLENCLREQEVVASPLEMAQWSCDRIKLARLCEKQGLARLGCALASADRSLIWHLSHILDVERGKLMTAWATRSISPQIIRRYIYQVVSLAKQLRLS